MDIQHLLRKYPGPLVLLGSVIAEANKAMVKGLVPQLVKFDEARYDLPILDLSLPWSCTTGSNCSRAHLTNDQIEPAEDAS